MIENTNSSSASARSSTLDVVRGVAIVSVVAVHSWEESWTFFDSPVSESSPLFQSVSLLRYGVELFFALSGWLIFSLYYKKNGIRGKSYWARRLLRIWPLWILFSIATILTLRYTNLTFPIGIEPLGQEPTLLVGSILIIFFLGWLSPFTWQTPAGGWSIQAEMGHYLLFWPLRKIAPIAIVCTIIVGYATYFIAYYFAIRSPEEFGTEFARSWIRLGLYGTWPFFVIGGLTYLWSRDRFSLRSDFYGKSKGVRGLFLLVASISLLIAFFIPVPFGRTSEAAIAVFGLLMCALIGRRLRYSAKVLASLGKYSYFIYFMHFWILAVLFQILPFPVNSSVSTLGLLAISGLALILSLAVSWVFALLSWSFLESPLLRLARKVPVESSPQFARPGTK